MKDEELNIAPEETPVEEGGKKPKKQKKQPGSRLAPAIVFLVFATLSLAFALISMPFDLAALLAKSNPENAGEAIGEVIVMVIVIVPIMILTIANSIIDIPLAIANTLVCIKGKRKATKVLMWISNGFYSVSIVIGIVKFIELLMHAG